MGIRVTVVPSSYLEDGVDRPGALQVLDRSYYSGQGRDSRGAITRFKGTKQFEYAALWMTARHPKTVSI
jgi:hypothetical protein